MEHLKIRQITYDIVTYENDVRRGYYRTTIQFPIRTQIGITDENIRKAFALRVAGLMESLEYLPSAIEIKLAEDKEIAY